MMMRCASSTHLPVIAQSGCKVKLPSQMKKNLRGPRVPPNSLAGMGQGFAMMYHLLTVGCSPVVGQEIHGAGSLHNPT